MHDGQFSITYNFAKPVLVKGYVIQTGNTPGEDPKDWTISCYNSRTKYNQDIHQVTDEP